MYFITCWCIIWTNDDPVQQQVYAALGQAESLTRSIFNTFRPRQNGRHFPDDNFKRIFLNENVRILIKISLKFVTKGPIINIPALVQIMAWRRSGDKPLSESMMVSLLTHICVTRPQWVKVKWNWIKYLPGLSDNIYETFFTNSVAVTLFMQTYYRVVLQMLHIIIG